MNPSEIAQVIHAWVERWPETDNLHSKAAQRKLARAVWKALQDEMSVVHISLLAIAGGV